MDNLKVIMTAEYISKDSSVKYSITYIRGKKIFGRAGDKTYPIVHQALLFRNGLLMGFASITKCDSDIDNLEFAINLVTKKVIDIVFFNDVKSGLLNSMRKELNKILIF